MPSDTTSRPDLMWMVAFHSALRRDLAHLADGVQRALGREPRDFADYARAAAATGVWDPPPAGRVA